MSDIVWTNDKRKLSQLIPWPRNPRKIEGAQVRRLQESFEEFGQPEVIAISPSNEVYNGHQRLKSWMQKYGDIEVDVRVASRALTEKEREKLTVLLHRGAVGEWDFATLASEFDVGELLEWGFDGVELGLEDAAAGTADAEAQVDRAEELRVKWDVKPGDLWKVGEHRLICGDCTDASVVGRVMGGERADMVFTDPPYGIAFDGSNRPDKHSRQYDSILQNDDRKGIGEFALAACRTCSDLLRDGGVVYLFTAIVVYPEWRQPFESCFKLRAIPVWVKDNPAAGRSDFFWGYEPMFYGTKGTITHTWNGGRGQSDVWTFPNVNSFGYTKDDGSRNAANDAQIHPTQKPTVLVNHAIELSSNRQNIVADPFLGSGTTMVACENLGRRCRAVEIAPGYVAVALERMAMAFPGIVIERVEE